MKSSISQDNPRTYRVRVRSGGWGWRSRLWAQYKSFPEFRTYSEIYNLFARLGYESTTAAWVANPIIEGGVNPSDYRKVSD